MVSYVFKRYEYKYQLTNEQYQTVKKAIDRQLSPDVFGETTIQSLYFDTENDRLARASIEKPVFKEKLRLRCYGINDGTKDVFLEMKRKYDGVVYKRRIACKETEIQDILSGRIPPSQIGHELQYFLTYYGNLVPKIMILYDRVAFFDSESDLRVTFDKNIRYRINGLDFHTSLEGKQLVSEDTVLMELKTGTAYPLWLCKILSDEHIYKSSFSKYGTAYEREYQNNHQRRSETICLNPCFVTEPFPQSVSLPS